MIGAPRVPLNDMFSSGMNGNIGKRGWCCGSMEHEQSAWQEAARTPSSLLIRGDLCRVSRSAGPKAEKVRWCWRARGPRGTPHAVPAETPSDTRRPSPWRPAPQVKLKFNVFTQSFLWRNIIRWYRSQWYSLFEGRKRGPPSSVRG